MSYERERSSNQRGRIHPNESRTGMYSNHHQQARSTSSARRHQQRSPDEPEERHPNASADEASPYPYEICSDDANISKSIRLQQIILDLIVIILTFLIFILVLLFVDPKLAYFTCEQSDIFYPYRVDTVPFWAVGLYATLAPVIIILAVEIWHRINPVGRKSLSSTFIDIYNFLSFFALGIAITLLTTEIGKRWVGRLRPHFIAVCQPSVNTFNCSVPSTISGYTYTAIYSGSASFCQNSDSSAVKEARLSFPSGHSSYSTFCMLYLIIYLEVRFISFRFRYLKLLIQTAAFIAAYVTCVSRVSDYHHRGSDVIGGVVLGALVTIFLTCVVARTLFWFDYFRAQEKYKR